MNFSNFSSPIKGVGLLFGDLGMGVEISLEVHVGEGRGSLKVVFIGGLCRSRERLSWGHLWSPISMKF